MKTQVFVVLALAFAAPAGEAAAKARTSTAAPARKQSRVTPGSLSRWSNAGAMAPVISEVPVGAPLPPRAVPIAPGAPTPGQPLAGGEDRLSAHFSAGRLELHTVGQDDNDLDVQRGRATIDYERVGGTEIGLHLDLEYRARSSGTRPTDRRVNALYLTYGLTDVRRKDAPAFGLAIGQLAVREAGYATALGGALRLRVLDRLHLGAFGGVTGNPYTYNYLLHKTEDFEGTDWLTGGLFAGFRGDTLFLDAAAVVTYTQIGAGGVDRAYAFVDAGWAVADTLDLFLSGWIDAIGRELVQNLELAGVWAPSRALHFRLSAARFSTLVADVSTAHSFSFDPKGNRLETNLGGVSTVSTAVDEEGNPIAVYDAALLSAVYNKAAARGGWRIGSFEPYLVFEVLARDTANAFPGLDIAPLRLQPAVGLDFRDPDLLDVSLRATAIVDDETDVDAVLEAGVSRAFFGFHAAADVRLFAGGRGAADGGGELGYALPRGWLPGRFLLRAQLRYYRENVVLARPREEDLARDPNGFNAIADNVALPVIPLQESWLTFLGVDWRL